MPAAPNRHGRSVLLLLCLIVLCLSGCLQAPRTVAPLSVASSPAALPLPLPAAPVKFVDVSRQAGIDFTATNGRTPNKYMLETMGSGCAFLDYDNDGRLDILLLNGKPLDGRAAPPRPTLKLYHNNGDGTFTDVTHKAGLDQTMYAMGCAVGDYDNDGWQDIYITCVLGPSKLYHNNGNGTFTDVAARAGVTGRGLWGTSCAWTDLDRDGRLDLVVCNYVVYSALKDDIPCYEGAGQRSYCIPSAYSSSHPILYHNNGDGTFSDISAKAGIKAEGKSLGVAIWDYDGDGLPDIFIANDGTQGFLFHNKGDNRFEEVGVKSGIAYDEQGRPHSGMGIDVNDLNNDGTCDVMITNYSGQETSLYTQVEKGLWRDDKRSAGIGPATMDTLGFGTLSFDYDNDGFKDIVIVNGHVQDTISKTQPNIHYAEPPFLFHNEGGGKFREVGQAAGSPFTTPIVARGVAWGDYDNDGKLDLLVTTNGGWAYLWHNETPTNNHWLQLKLVGVKSNRDGIGAVVTVNAGGRTVRTAVRSGSSYLSASDLRAHVGLGTANRADIEVKWPSGIVDRLPATAADHIWTLREGSGKLK
jgi:hypothetical protein